MNSVFVSVEGQTEATFVRDVLHHHLKNFNVELNMEIGLETIRAECPHFASWLAWLEGLG